MAISITEVYEVNLLSCHPRWQQANLYTPTRTIDNSLMKRTIPSYFSGSLYPSDHLVHD
jgi:hypothetical protein